MDRLRRIWEDPLNQDFIILAGPLLIALVVILVWFALTPMQLNWKALAVGAALAVPFALALAGTRG
jgi:hypothetical protein